MNPLRTTCLDRARNDTQDSLVIGGGINGAVSAAALAAKGLKVTVIDKGDFASCTSQESSNLAWGGIKYLENYEFSLVQKLCSSRNHLMDSYPGQVREIRFFTSMQKGFRKPRFLIYCGTLLYWFMGGCRTKAPRLLSVSAIRKEAPMVNTESLAGGIEYSDAYFVENDARFTFSFIRRVLRKGGNAINYAELISGQWKNGLWECKVRDRVSGDTFRIKSRTLINAAGPYVDRINTMLNIISDFRHIFSKGVHIIVPRIARTRHVLTFFASDGRLFFMIPMGNRTCIGTTDTRTDTENADSTDDDVQFLLDNANRLLQLKQPLTQENVIARRCGVRPLVVHKEDAVTEGEWTSLSRKHEIDVQPDKNMFSIYGGKLTDCINIGNEAAELITSFGLTGFQSLEKWYGEPSAEKHRKFETDGKKLGLTGNQLDRIWRRHGKTGFQVLEKIKRDPKMLEKLLAGITRAELHLMAEQEMVVHLEDFLRRRTHLALTEHRAALRCHPALAETANILFGDRAEEEIEHYFSSTAG
ncbi:glycerol-3-phosphate dehydrogenase/oxidase [Pontiella agarivorans]|uniref:Glycerol-3-phosphate dehydrogenase/oxidase n=1 Tax=Pontiella agarivorans TaxID=3038953 RepID=A0ABU5MVN0_9BACT|nr:glycerol-3-phosphate dehydrogenase/oxidase [Pontiella agarivorans]MDZ8118269.1 glycerol-3-phosphate dehydrogenase/oxidase [Pontiella agarivorans]